MGWEFGVTISVLVYLAFAFDLFGFMARDEFWLRILMLAASGLYLFYYYNVAATPLWDAIYTNAALAVVNLVMIVVVVLERTTITMSRETKELFRQFHMLTPGQFRRVLKAARVVRAAERQELTHVGDHLTNLYFVFDGPILIEKGNRETPVDGGMFIGEVAFLTNRPATATVYVEPGTRYLDWNSDDLHRLLRKSSKLNLALSAQFNADLVRKVAMSLPGIGG